MILHLLSPLQMLAGCSFFVVLSIQIPGSLSFISRVILEPLLQRMIVSSDKDYIKSFYRQSHLFIFQNTICPFLCQHFCCLLPWYRTPSYLVSCWPNPILATKLSLSSVYPLKKKKNSWSSISVPLVTFPKILRYVTFSKWHTMT